MSEYYLNIDNEGFLFSDGARLNDEAFGKIILENLYVENRVYHSKYEDRSCLLYSFDHPLIVQSVDKTAAGILLKFPYGYSLKLDFTSLRLDEWDRFCGWTDKNIPYVFSRKAQAQFFDALDSFDDDSVTFAAHQYELPPFFPNAEDKTSEEFWTNRYVIWKEQSEKPGWDLGQAHPALDDILPQIKINKASVAVLGAGASHDAHYLASLGHVVTAFDISDEAIAKAKSLYPESTNLKYVKCDLLKEIPSQYKKQFDLIFEHTFFCAINPQDRPKAIKTYKDLLHEDGHILGIFFTMDILPGPPFGATEWELKQRLDKTFRPLYWTRWQKSPKGREGWELIAFLQRR